MNARNDIPSMAVTDTTRYGAGATPQVSHVHLRYELHVRGFEALGAGGHF